MLPLRQPFMPMEAQSVDEIPTGKEWQYEPKWDGFRCLIFRDGGSSNCSQSCFSSARSQVGYRLRRYSK